MQRLGPHLLHEPRPLDRLGEAWVILDIGCDGELAAWLDSLDQHGLQHGARRIDRRRIPCRTGPHNYESRITLCHGAFFSPSLVLHRTSGLASRFYKKSA